MLKAQPGNRPASKSQARLGERANAQRGAGKLPAALAIRMGFLLGRSAQFMREGFDRQLEPLGIQCRHYSILSLMFHDGPLTQNTIGERLLIDRTTMVTLIDELEKLGLASREPNEKDRRSYQVTITAAGRKVFSTASKQGLAVESEILAPLTEVEWNELRRILAKLVDHQFEKATVQTKEAADEQEI